MKANVGGVDRVLRIVLGLVLIGLAATGTVGWCPPYAIFGISSCKMKARA